MPHPLSEEMRACAQLCGDCRAICIETSAHCLEMGGRHAQAAHLNLLLNCAEICETSSSFLLRSSLLHTATCRACAEVCGECARSCRGIGSDATMLRCAEICERCAESCFQMAEMTTA